MGLGIDIALDQAGSVAGDALPGLFCRHASSQIFSVWRAMDWV
ncbi:hypothetical protein [Aeromonas sp. S16(2024)]